MKLLIVEYDALLGDYQPDGLINDYVNRLIYTFNEETEDGETRHRVVASELIVASIRAAITQKRLDSEDVVFRYKGQDIKPNKDGSLPNWPKGFCDTYDELLNILVGLDSLS